MKVGFQHCMRRHLFVVLSMTAGWPELAQSNDLYLREQISCKLTVAASRPHCCTIKLRVIAIV